MDYLKTTSQIPFLIISEISLLGLCGLELRQQIDQDSGLCKTFVFMTHPVEEEVIEVAYKLTIQILFEKKATYACLESSVSGHYCLLDKVPSSQALDPVDQRLLVNTC